MSTLTRTKPTGYKDYVNFLGHYKSGKKDDQISIQSTDSGVSVKSFPLSPSSSNTSASSLNSDVTDFYQKPASTQNYSDNKTRSGNESKTMRTEIYIQVQNPVSEVSKIFQPFNEEKKISKNTATISKKISMFEQVVEEKSPIKKHVKKTKSNVAEIAQQLEAMQKQESNEKIGKTQNGTITKTDWITPTNPLPQLEKPVISEKPKFENHAPIAPPPPPMMPSNLPAPKISAAVTKQQNCAQIDRNDPAIKKLMYEEKFENYAPIAPPPPPTMPSNFAAPKIPAAVTKQQNGGQIDRNDPAIKKLVYGALMDMYGAYHGKANDFVATLPRNMVKKDNEVQNIIEQIAPQSRLPGVGPGLEPSAGGQLPPPPPLVGHIPGVRLKSEIPERRMEPPPCVQNAMMKQDKKPFTYTPGGIDLSEIKSPRMARRIERNANYTGAPEPPRPAPQQNVGPLPPSALAAMQPQMHVQVFPSGPPPPPGSRGGAPPPPPPPPAFVPPPPPLQPLPTQKVVTSENQVIERPDMTKIIPDNPIALLRKTGGPRPKSFVDEMYSPQPPQQQRNPPAQQRSPPAQQPQWSPPVQQGSAQLNSPQAQQWTPQPTTPQAQQWTPQPTTPQAQQWTPQPTTAQPQQWTPQSNSPQIQQWTPQPNSPQAQQWSPQPNSPQAQRWSPPTQPKSSPAQQWSPPIIERNGQKPMDQQVKTSTAHLGSLYIPPINQQQKGSPRAPTPPRRDPQSPQAQSPPTPTLKEGPKPWQKQQQSPELPPWAKREAGQISPESIQMVQSPQVQQRFPQSPNQRSLSPQSAPNAVYVTQPLVLQHPGPPPNRQQPPKVDAQGARIIPVQVESGKKPATPDRPLNRQQSWGNNPPQSNAFKVIQKITQTDGEDVDENEPVVEHGPRYTQQFQQTPPAEQMRKMKLAEGDRDLMNRFRQEEEDPRYRGGVIPSRVFRILDESGIDDDTYLHNEVDPRYRGPAIPSKAFKLLQSMTDGSPESASTQGATVSRGPPAGNKSPQVRTIPIQIERDEPPKNYVHPSEQTVPEPKKYTGSSIPSRSFKMLQAMTAPDSCANANEVNENYDPSSYWGYDPNYPPPVPPYWPDYYYNYYYPNPQAKDETDDKDARQTPVPYWGFYPPPYPYMQRPLKTPDVESESETARNTPLPCWGYYPYYTPTPTPTPTEGEDWGEYPQNGKEEDNQQNYAQYPPYWDPYYYNYYYGYPPMYSPYPFYGPMASDNEETAGYSSTDEMAYFSKKINDAKRESESARDLTPKILVTPTLPQEFNGPNDEKSEDEKYSDDDSETAVEEDDDDDDDENDEKLVRKSNGLIPTIRSVKDIRIYDNDEEENSDEEPIVEENSEELDDNDDSGSIEGGDDEMIPHQLSIIFEESERTDTSRRESSILSDSTTIAERSDDEEDEESSTTVSVKLPLKLKFEISENEEVAATITVGESEINEVSSKIEEIFNQPSKSESLQEINEAPEVAASFTLKSPCVTPKKDLSLCRFNSEENLAGENEENCDEKAKAGVQDEEPKTPDSCVDAASSSEEDWWGILAKDEDEIFVKKVIRPVNAVEEPLPIISDDVSSPSENFETVKKEIADNLAEIQKMKIIKEKVAAPPLRMPTIETLQDEMVQSAVEMQRMEIVEEQIVLDPIIIQKVEDVRAEKLCSVVEIQKEENQVREEKLYGSLEIQKIETDDEDDASSSSSSDSSCGESNAPKKEENEDSSQSEEESESEKEETNREQEEKPELLSIKERIEALKNSIKQKQTIKEETEIKVSVKNKVSAIEVGNQNRSKTTSTKSSVKSFEEFSEEEGDSGVTSDMSRHISDNEEFPELKKMTRYQRAATHSRLFKLLQEECEESDEECETKESKFDKLTVRQRDDNKEEAPRRDQLSLPLKAVSDPESFSSSGVTSPGSPVNEKLVTELVKSILKRKKGQMFRHLPKEKLVAAAKKILQEEFDDLSTPDSSFLSPLRNGTESSTPAQTPQEFYNDYKQYYDTWSDALGNEDYEILPSKAFRLLQEHSGLNKTGAIAGLLAKCPKVLSAKNVHQELLKLLESSESSSPTPDKSLEPSEVTSAS